MAKPDQAAIAYSQAWDVWMRNNLVDFVIPMVFITQDDMASASTEALKSSFERHVYMGVGGWRVSPQLAVSQIQGARAAGARGVVLFSYHYLGPNSPSAACVKGSDLTASVFAAPSPVAAMAWRQ